MQSAEALHHVLHLDTGKLGFFHSEEDFTLFAQSCEPATARRWVVSKDQRNWLPLMDWLNLRDTQPDFTPDSAVLDRRHSPRFEMRFQVNLVSHGRAFASYSCDISELGVRLERAVPATLPRGACEVVIVAPGNRDMIKLRGRIGEAEEDAKRVTFAPDGNIKELLPWLFKWIAKKTPLRA